MEKELAGPGCRGQALAKGGGGPPLRYTTLDHSLHTTPHHCSVRTQDTYRRYHVPYAVPCFNAQLLRSRFGSTSLIQLDGKRLVVCTALVGRGGDVCDAKMRPKDYSTKRRPKSRLF